MLLHRPARVRPSSGAAGNFGHNSIKKSITLYVARRKPQRRSYPQGGRNCKGCARCGSAAWGSSVRCNSANFSPPPIRSVSHKPLFLSLVFPCASGIFPRLWRIDQIDSSHVIKVIRGNRAPGSLHVDAIKCISKRCMVTIVIRMIMSWNL